MKIKIIALVMGLAMLGQLSVRAQSVTVVANSNTAATYNYSSSELSQNVRNIQGSAYTVVSLENASPSHQIGAPDLPIITEMIEIPLCGNINVSVSNVRTKTLDKLTYPMMPVQPAPSKADKGPRPFVMDSSLYARNAFYGLETAWVEVLGVARDRNVAMLHISPLSYNPVTGEMKIITEMTINVTYEDADIAATEELHSRYYSPDFALGTNLLSSLPLSKSVRTGAPLHYLIVAHNSFRGQLDDFVAWKKRQGFLVTVGYTGDAGVGTSSTSIASYIKSFYTNATEELPAPTYLLLVGDNQQIPAFSSRCTSPASDHVTDLYYVTWTQGDNIPDCYLGRFSARSVAELTPQIEKTLYYEGYNFTDPSYLAKGILIAGEDQGYSSDNAYRYADPAMDYIAKTYINASNGYTTVKYYKNNTDFAPSGVTVNGSSQTNSTASTLRSLYNEGYGWINYSAHGYDDCWGTPEFTTRHVANMTNNGKPSVMIGNCCLSGKFNTTYDACLGEALLRKDNNAGAVAYFGGTNSTYWPHDFCWSVGVRSDISNTMNANYNGQHLGMYDRLFHTHNEDYTAWHTTAGSMNVAGNMAVEDYGSYQLYYWEIYELFGDPSLMPWLAVPSEMPFAADTVVSLGLADYIVQTAPHAYVAVTTLDNHDLLCAAYADASGQAVLHLPSDINPGQYELAVWAQNCRPLFKNLVVKVADGPYVMATEMENNGALKLGAVATFKLSLANIGNAYAYRTDAVFSSLTPGVTVIDTAVAIWNIDSADALVFDTLCPVFISPNMKDGDEVRIKVSLNCGSNTSAKTFVFNVSAPNIVLSGDPQPSSLLSGEAVSISFDVVNSGSDTTGDVTFTLVDDFGMVSMDGEPVHAGIMVPGSHYPLAFTLVMADNLPNTFIPLRLVAATANGTWTVDTLYFRVGASEIEDFESGTLSQFPWNVNRYPWTITTSGVYEGTYCARSKSDLPSSSESRMTVTLKAATDDSISFYYKVSSEEGYDKFRFYIDGAEKLNASGEEGWTYAAFPVSAGTHIFAFSYTKDYSTVHGSDMAMVDRISFPFGGDNCHFVHDNVCQGDIYVFADDTVATDQVGTFVYIDTCAAEHVYLSLEVVETPQVTIEQIGHAVMGEGLLLKANGADRYVWSTGDTTDCIAVDFSGTTTYSVVGYRANCSNEASITLVGINDVASSAKVSVYPNPAHNSVTVAAEHIRSIELVNMMGQSILRQNCTGDVAVVDVQNLPEGVYFIKVELLNASVVKKLIVK